MPSGIYLKLVKYFIGLILVTFIGVAAIFHLTVGAGVGLDVHTLMRNHCHFLGQLTGEMIDQGASQDSLTGFFNQTYDAYKLNLALYDGEERVIAQSREIRSVPLTEEMRSDVLRKGIFVQPSHFGKPLIFVVPVKTSDSGTHYLMIHKPYGSPNRGPLFLIGLAVLCLVLIVAIYPLAKGFTKPLITLKDAVKDVAAGDFKSDIQVVKRKDELGQLLNEFVNMRQSIDDMIESRKVLLADISHELRSPLGRMSVAVELLREEGSPADQARYIENLDYEINYMNSLLGQLRQYSILNLPDAQVQMEPFFVKDVLAKVFKHYRPTLETRELQFSLQCQAEDDLVEGDPLRVEQVLNNLLDNAINAVSQEGRIWLGCQGTEEGLRIFVGNSGQGIPEELQERIFEPLFRVDSSRSRKTGGLGLGLTISRKIIEMHGSTISCTSDDGETVFSFELKQAP